MSCLRGRTERAQGLELMAGRRVDGEVKGRRDRRARRCGKQAPGRRGAGEGAGAGHREAWGGRRPLGGHQVVEQGFGRGPPRLRQQGARALRQSSPVMERGGATERNPEKGTPGWPWEGEPGQEHVGLCVSTCVRTCVFLQ
ncbi:unnamed protein product [Gulo gulo]|uniref:Uncharacterized protein n=1 Tax=Gulo gulo TaxID=48420 RepID=A0A9X9LR58_GULGU|nr:unnamed protein product [Gulo gulo]